MLQADAFACDAELYRVGTIQAAARMAHACRKRHDLRAVRSKALTEEALRQIAALYEIEEQIRGKLPDERHSMRQARAVPQLDDMKRWLDSTLTKLLRKSDTTKAIQYVQTRCPSPIYTCSDERAEIDNLIAERALRGVAIGKRNYLYSLIVTAGLNGLDPDAYLADVLDRIADHLAIRIDELLRWHVAPSLPSDASVEPIR